MGDQGGNLGINREDNEKRERPDLITIVIRIIMADNMERHGKISGRTEE